MKLSPLRIWPALAATLALSSCGPLTGGAAGGNTPANRTARSAAVEDDIHDQVNSYRRSQGKPALKRNPTLDRLAREHSRDMLMRSGPDSPKIDHRGTSHRFDVASAELGVNAKAENVCCQSAGSNNPARAIVNEWIASKGHLANIRGQWSLSGVGIETDTRGRIWATQIFTPAPLRGNQVGSSDSLMTPMRAW